MSASADHQGRRCSELTSRRCSSARCSGWRRRLFRRAQLAQLQRVVGNQAVGRLLRMPEIRFALPVAAVQRMKITIGDRTFDTERVRDRERIKELLGDMAPAEARRVFRAARLAASAVGEDPYGEAGANEIDAFLAEQAESRPERRAQDATGASGTLSSTSRMGGAAILRSRRERATPGRRAGRAPRPPTPRAARPKPEPDSDLSSRVTASTSYSTRSRGERDAASIERESTATTYSTRTGPSRSPRPTCRAGSRPRPRPLAAGARPSRRAAHRRPWQRQTCRM